jgi:predicted metal-dependent HD superfamily phosphohydrolase
MSIESYFDQLRTQLAPAPLDWENVRHAYANRAYHNLDHLQEMLDHLEHHRTAGATVIDEHIFGMALVYHDLVYKPTRKDNEARSAAAAADLLGQHPALDQVRIDRCTQLIMATKIHLPGPDDTGDEALLIDLDLAVLARGTDGYDRYATAVRKEFWMLPGFVFRKGRSKALTSFLDREHIYHTEFGQKAYETKARENLWRELRER